MAGPRCTFRILNRQAREGYLTPRDLAVRVKGDPMAYARALEGAVWQVDRNQPIADVMPMERS